MDEDEVEMMVEAEVPDSPGDTEKTEGDEETEGGEDDQYRCKHYRRKCQFVVSINWSVYNGRLRSIMIGKIQFGLRMLWNDHVCCVSDQNEINIGFIFGFFREMRESLLRACENDTLTCRHISIAKIRHVGTFKV